MTTPTEEKAEPKPSRRLLHLSVRALMVFVLLLALGLGWIVHRAKVQREAVAAINEKSIGTVLYDWQLTPGGALNRNGQPWVPKWLVERLGVDYFGHVAIVSLNMLAKPPITEAVMEQIGRLDQLEVLQASGAKGVTDVGVAHLRGLTHLRELRLGGAKVTGAGLVHLRGMTGLKQLDLQDIPLTDADLSNLEGLTRMEILTLTSPWITDAGLAHLKGMTQLKRLNLPLTGIRGEGLEHLELMNQLRFLNLTRSRIADLSFLPPLPALISLDLDGAPVDSPQLAFLSKASNLEILGLSLTNVDDTGLTKLEGFKRTLKRLRLSGTKITDAGIPSLLILENLEILDLADTKVTDATLDRITGFKNLKTFDVKGATITDVGLDRLRQTLPELKSTREVEEARKAQRWAQAKAASKSSPTKPGPMQ
jgi:internalin A